MNHLGMAVAICLLSITIVPITAQQACPRRGILIRVAIDLDVAEHYLDLEKRDYVSGFKAFLPGSKLKGIFYRSHFDHNVGVLLTEEFLVVSLDEDSDVLTFDIDWKKVVETELCWLLCHGDSIVDLTGGDIEQILGITKCCGAIVREGDTWKLSRRRSLDFGVDISASPALNEQSENGFENSHWLGILLISLGLFVFIPHRIYGK